jgi:hypothetical protein
MSFDWKATTSHFLFDKGKRLCLDAKHFKNGEFIRRGPSGRPYMVVKYRTANGEKVCYAQPVKLRPGFGRYC